MAVGEEKSLFVTYLLWLTLGWFGVHHFYLRRDKQAFVWWSTLGGYFWLGWARDFWRIPEYVDDANEEEDYMEDLERKMKFRRTPSFNVTRFVGEVFIGSFYGVLVRLALPDETPSFVLTIFLPMGMTAGVYLVGNIGREKGQYFMPYVATLLTYIFFYATSGAEPGYVNCCLVSAVAFNYYREWDKSKNEDSISKRLGCLSIRGIVVIGLWTSFFYFNATITYQNGEKVKLTESVKHFFKSPVWLDFRHTFWSLYKEGESKKWKNLYDDVLHSFDPTGERNARATLGVNELTPEEDVKKRYKKLIFQWHPDKYKGDDKEDAQRKFIEIQQAYELLQKRFRKNSTFSRSQRTDL